VSDTSGPVVCRRFVPNPFVELTDLILFALFMTSNPKRSLSFDVHLQEKEKETLPVQGFSSLFCGL